MSGSHMGKTCPYCQYPIKQELEAVRCSGCQVPHHRECWEDNGGCTTFGCQTINYVLTEADNRNKILYKPRRQAVAVSNGARVNKFLAATLILAIMVIILLAGYIVLDIDDIANSSEYQRDEFYLQEHIEQLNGTKEIDDILFEEPETIIMQDDETQIYIIGDGDYLLALVTKETTLKSDYKPADLQQIPSYMNPSYTMYLRARALNQLELLWAAAEADGVNLQGIHSAYHSYYSQNSLFNDYASRYGETEASRFIARPGQSEHQLGTTVDFGGTVVDFQAAYADTEQGRWLASNAYLYGFVLSYPAGKEHITGYIFKPWHYRYIGVDAAMDWNHSGKTLREYLKTKPQFFIGLNLHNDNLIA